MSTIQSQYTESNLVGALTNSITTSATTIVTTFYDRISGAQRTPLASTKLFVIDKGTEQFPNANYEIVLAGSHATVSGITTLSSCTRGIAFSGTSLAGGTGKSHIANSQIGCVDVHYLWTILASILDGTNSPAAFKLGTRLTYELAGEAGFRPFVDATARDAAIVSPADGDNCVLTGTGVAQIYYGGTWNNVGNSVTANMSTIVAGKAQAATVANQIAHTSVGSTGALLVPQVGNFITTSTGAGDAGKLAVTDVTGRFDSSLVPTAVTVPTGAIFMWGTNSAPTSYLLLDGSAVSRATFASLFALWGTTFGVGDGVTTFNIADFRGKIGVGRDSGDANFDILNTPTTYVGEKTHVLITSEMPVHTHDIATQSTNSGGGTASIQTNAGAPTGVYPTNSAGSSVAHNNIQPYIVINYIVKT